MKSEYTNLKIEGRDRRILQNFFIHMLYGLHPYQILKLLTIHEKTLPVWNHVERDAVECIGVFELLLGTGRMQTWSHAVHLDKCQLTIIEEYQS